MSKTCLDCKWAVQMLNSEQWACEEYYGGMPCHVEPPYDTPCQFYEDKEGDSDEKQSER